MCDRKSIAVSAPDLGPHERAHLLQAFDSSWISSRGTFVSRFEARFAQFVGTSHAVSCTNGTSALHLALLALGVGSGDEVIVPDLTYVATANVVRYVGAEPVFADSDPDTWTVKPESVVRLIGRRTKAIVCVHLLGVPADLEALRCIATDAGCALVEDVAETPGARWAGHRVGTVGEVSTFSFYGNKMITTGEGGAVCTDDDSLALRIRKLRGQGADPDRHYWFDEVGYNYRMTNLACAIGLAQLDRFREIAAKRKAVRSSYEQCVADAGLPAKLQHCPSQADPSWWMIGAVLDSSSSVDRDTLCRELQDGGVETRPFFLTMSSLSMYANCQTDAGCPVAQRLAQCGLMLPTHSHLDGDDIRHVVSRMTAAMRGTARPA